MPFEPKYWEAGELPPDLAIAVAKFVDDNVCEAIVHFLDGVTEDATIDGRGIWLIDTDFDDKNWCISVKDAVQRTIEQYEGMMDDEEVVRWLREARQHLLECVAALEKVL